MEAFGDSDGNGMMRGALDDISFLCVHDEKDGAFLHMRVFAPVEYLLELRDGLCRRRRVLTLRYRRINKTVRGDAIAGIISMESILIRWNL